MRKVTIVWYFSVFVMMCLVLCAVPLGAQSQSARAAPDASGFALLVDVSDYGDASIKPLPSEGAGVSDIRDALQSTGGFPGGQINILRGGSATREGIVEALTSVMERASGKSEVRFCFYLKGRSLDSQGKTYFLPYDARVGAPPLSDGSFTLHDKAGNTTIVPVDQISAAFTVFASRYALGKYCFDAENYTEALSQLKQVSPPTDDALYLAALSHRHLKDADQAIERRS
jgi:hypothetical protein